MGRGRFVSRLRKRMTNQTLRERFHITEEKAGAASQVIATTVEAGLIRPDESVGGSKKFARYLPFWA
jgi:ATP-dependent DNA helicase RecG